MGAARDSRDELPSEARTPNPARVGRADRDREVVEQVICGESISHIGRSHGFASPGASIRLVDRALDAVLPTLSRQQQQRVDLARLDCLLQAWWKRATEGDLEAARVVLATIEERTRALAALEAGRADELGPVGRSGVAGT